MLGVLPDSQLTISVKSNTTALLVRENNMNVILAKNESPTVVVCSFTPYSQPFLVTALSVLLSHLILVLSAHICVELLVHMYIFKFNACVCVHLFLHISHLCA